MIFAVIYWANDAQTVVFRFASIEKAKTLTMAKDYIVRLNVLDSGYETFVLSSLGEWDGEAVDVTDLPTGKLTLLSFDVN